MDKLDYLWQLAKDRDVFVDFAPLTQRHPKLWGLYIAAGPAILLDETLRYRLREQKCVLAEEVFHALTYPRTDVREVYRSYRRYGECNETIVMGQDERKALRKACDFLIPDAELCKAMEKGYWSCYEIAEYFDVTEWVVYRKLGFLKDSFRRQGLKVKGRELFNVRMGTCQVAENEEEYTISK